MDVWNIYCEAEPWSYFVFCLRENSSFFLGKHLGGSFSFPFLSMEEGVDCKFLAPSPLIMVA